jgi:glycerol-3-phosphate dehydrogenase (NAD(P)+)
MGTAMAMHAARRGLDVALWGSQHDARALDVIRAEGRHPSLPEHMPGSISVYGPEALDSAAAGCEVAVLAANSRGARPLATMIRGSLSEARFVVSLAKGLESESGRRVSQVYGDEIPGPVMVAVGGPCLAPELAQGAPSAAVWSAGTVEDARSAGEAFEDRHYQLEYIDDMAGLEFCTTAKNVTAIGAGIIDGLAKLADERFRNAQAALFTRAVHELCRFVAAMGGRMETALGLAGLGDLLVTSLGGRNRLYGEHVGEGARGDDRGGADRRGDRFHPRRVRALRAGGARSALPSGRLSSAVRGSRPSLGDGDAALTRSPRAAREEVWS